MAEYVNQNIGNSSVATRRVVCLYRVSTVGQVEKDDIPMQKQYCREFSRRQPGWEIVKEFSEKGVSGFKVSAKDRDAIQEIQRMALQNEFDILLVFMFDRLGRKDDETPFVVEWFVKQDIEVWSAMEGQQRFDSHVDKLLNYIRYWQASGESIKTSLRVKTRLEQLTQDGYYTGGCVPFGYRREILGRTSKSNRPVGDLVVEPNEAEVVKLIFQKYVYEGYGSLRICRYLMDQGICNKEGKNIPINTITRIVKNPIYIGIIRNGESKSEILPDLQIIAPELFSRAQEIMQKRARPRSDVPLTTRGRSLMVNNVFCGHCGGHLILYTSGQKYRRKDGTVSSKTYSSYQCSRRLCRPGVCDGQACYSVAKVDNLVDQIVRIQFERIKQAPPKALIEKRQSREVDFAQAKVKLLSNQYQQKQRDFQDLKAETLKVVQGISRLNVDVLNSLIDETNAQMKDLEVQMQTAELELREAVSGAEQINKEYTQLIDWAKLYDNCTFDAKKMIISQFVKAVHVKRGFEIDIEFNVSFEEFQTIYLDAETEDDKKQKNQTILAYCNMT